MSGPGSASGHEGAREVLARAGVAVLALAMLAAGHPGDTVALASVPSVVVAGSDAPAATSPLPLVRARSLTGTVGSHGTSKGRGTVATVPRAGVPPDGPVEYVDEIPPGSVELAFVGDVNLGGRVGDVIAARGADYPWTQVERRLAAADLAVVNLECAVSLRGEAREKEYTFRGHPSSVPAMASAGVDVASVANNHAMDFGPMAFLDTLSHLRRAFVAPVGGGADDAEAWEPVVVERRGRRFAFVAASRVLPHNFRAGPETAGVASAYDQSRLLAAVRNAADRADVVAVLVHWGVERSTEPDGNQTALARKLVEAGASIVVGHHPHVLQPVERYRGAVIAYSLGNFVFSSGSPSGNRSMILRIGVSPAGAIAVARVPIRIVNGRPEPAAA